MADRPLRVGIDAHLMTYRRGIGTSVYNLVDGTSADLPGKASFNAFAPSITNGGDAFTVIDRNKLALVPVSVDAAEWAKTPALGLMIVSEDNKSGDTQGFLIPVK